MTTQEVAQRFYELARQGQFDQIQRELYSPAAKSIEPVNFPWQSVSGLDSIIQKSKDWNAQIEEYHEGHATIPQVAGNFFTCTLKMDFTTKDKRRIVFEEVAVYEVKEGKIVSEQFFY